MARHRAVIEADLLPPLGEGARQLLPELAHLGARTSTGVARTVGRGTISVGRIDVARVDATTEADIAKNKAADDADAMPKFVRRVRWRLGVSQAEFAERIGVSLDTIRNWEQGKRSPAGAAKALLKVLDKAPEAALAALH